LKLSCRIILKQGDVKKTGKYKHRCFMKACWFSVEEPLKFLSLKIQTLLLFTERKFP